MNMAAEDEQVMKETNPAGMALQVTSPATGTSGGVNWGQADSFYCFTLLHFTDVFFTN